MIKSGSKVWILRQVVLSKGPKETDTVYGIFHDKYEAESQKRYWDKDYNPNPNIPVEVEFQIVEAIINF